jgi:hypothetical protein
MEVFNGLTVFMEKSSRRQIDHLEMRAQRSEIGFSEGLQEKIWDGQRWRHMLLATSGGSTPTLSRPRLEGTAGD